MKIILDSRTDRVRIVDSPNRQEDLFDDENEGLLELRDSRAEGISEPTPILDRDVLLSGPIRFHPRFPESGVR